MKLLLTCSATLSSLSGRTTNAAGTGATAAGLLLPITGGGQGAAMQRKTFAALQRLPESGSSTDKLYIENACESTHSDSANGAYENDVAVERDVQSIAFGVSFNLNLQSQSHWLLFNGTWQKRPRELDQQLRFETEEMTFQVQ